MMRGNLDQLERAYENEPSERNFYLLYQEAMRRDSYHLVSVVYRAKFPKESSLRSKHLTDAFLLEQRWLEAQCFCDLWLKSSPNSVIALRTGFLIAAKRGSVQRAIFFHDRLRAVKAPENILWLGRTIFSLVFQNCHNVEVYAANMLLSPPPLDSIALDVALEAAIRTKHGDLLWETLVRLGRVPALTPWQNKVVVETLRIKLIEVLNSRIGVT